ncbi:MAG: PDZ domain-containing protein [Planctomycetota bacterium]
MLQRVNLLGCALFLLIASGCSSGPRPVYERAWVGGEFDEKSVAVPAAADGDDWRWGVLVTDVYAETPIALAGIQAGDVILGVDRHATECASELHDAVESAQPGDSLQVRVFRSAPGSTSAESAHTVVVGVEKFERTGRLSLGLGLSTELDLLPNASFNILGVLRYTARDCHPQLAAPRPRLRRALASEPPKFRGRGWSFWCVVFGLGKYDEIVAQELHGSS